MDKMTDSGPNTNDQKTLWNGIGGRAWVEKRELLDHVLKPFEELLMEAISPGPADRILDVGCGAGTTTLRAARLLGPKGRCLGIDISEDMIAAARSRADQEGIAASFLCGDVEAHAFETASWDWIISRFGVMFFEDPVRAFANLSRAAAESARLRFVAWRSASENPFMTTAERAAATVLPNVPARQPDAPGQFAFANDRRVGEILERSGWARVEIRPVDIACSLPERELIPYVTHVGPVGRMLQEADERTRAQVIETVRPAFDPFVQGAEVRFTAACWMVTAQSGAGTSADRG